MSPKERIGSYQHVKYAIYNSVEVPKLLGEAADSPIGEAFHRSRPNITAAARVLGISHLYQLRIESFVSVGAGCWRQEFRKIG
jgi:hypothetical protein